MTEHDSMYYLGIDAGSSGLKAVLMDQTGALVASASVSYPLLSIRPGWVEADPEVWWSALCEATRRVLESAGLTGAQIAGVGLSGQMHTLVLLDGHRRPVRPAISWADTRGERERVEIESRVGRERLIATTGSPAVTAFTSTKLLWVRRHEPDVWAKARHALLAKDYLRLRLTGNLATDPTDAGATGLLDIRTRGWSSPVLDALEIPSGLLPEIHPSAAGAGVVSPEAAAATGLREGTPVATGAGDQECAALGCGVLAPGPVLVTIGTGGQVFAATDSPLIDPQGRIHTLPHLLPDTWHELAAIPAAGLALDWLRSMLIPITHTTPRLSSDPPLFVPAVAGERTPSMDTQVRGSFFGLDLSHGVIDLVFAVREGIAFALRSCLDVLMELGISTDRLIITGGLTADRELLTILAGVLQRPLELQSQREGSGRGAALLGAAAAGRAIPEFESPSTIEVVTPDSDRTRWHTLRYETFMEASALTRRLKTHTIE